ncbi:terminase large subunit domain-containing protein [Costertonia aggregata]|uniref:Terminase n=1 Tax=Costertonia aggregata TaxID=343403 RepID=A0A7H9AS73_9FLAO|nr:terminase family protein [Costertonia aggregata]QLG46045.1 hypothetical protein HYG79_12050 [Costertonia aggregata]
MQISINRPKLTDYQNEFLYDEARFSIITASTKVGKTYACIWWLFEQAHLPLEKEGYNYWWIAPTYSQAQIAFNRMKRKVVKSKAYTVNKNELIIYCPNKAEIHFKTASDPDNLYGEDVHALVFDECGRASEEAWFALRSTLTATNAPAKLIGNFGGANNWVTKLAEKSKNDPNYSFHKITAYDAVDAGILSLDEVEQAKRDLPEQIFKSLYLAEGGNDENRLIQDESLKKLLYNEVNTGIKYLTGDIARFGNDKTVLFVWSGLKIIDWLVIDKSTLTDVATQINLFRVKYNINLQNIILDENGVGGGVIDIVGCRGFVNNAKPIKVNGESKNFDSLKSQCYIKLSEMINANMLNVSLPHSIMKLLTEELEQVKLAAIPDLQRLKIMAKDAIKKIIGRSPDYSDALMMRMFFELNPNYGIYNIR